MKKNLKFLKQTRGRPSTNLKKKLLDGVIFKFFEAVLIMKTTEVEINPQTSQEEDSSRSSTCQVYCFGVFYFYYYKSSAC